MRPRRRGYTWSTRRRPGSLYPPGRFGRRGARRLGRAAWTSPPRRRPTALRTSGGGQSVVSINGFARPPKPLSPPSSTQDKQSAASEFSRPSRQGGVCVCAFVCVYVLRERAAEGAGKEGLVQCDQRTARDGRTEEEASPRHPEVREGRLGRVAGAGGRN